MKQNRRCSPKPLDSTPASRCAQLDEAVKPASPTGLGPFVKIQKCTSAVTKAHQQLDEELDQLSRINPSFSNALSQLHDLHLKFLGKRGIIVSIMGMMSSISPSDRPKFGQMVNELKANAEAKIRRAQTRVEADQLHNQMASESLDVSLPGLCGELGSAHPVTIAIQRAEMVLRELGFSLHDAPEIDSEYYMFDALNFPKDHPARDMQDTFYLGKKSLLRSHTTNAQVRLLQTFGAPLRAAVSGICFRNEDVSARSLVSFHQIDILVVDKKVCYGDLIFHLECFFERLLGRKAQLRVRLSYFPFVQPGIEVDIRCWLCKGNGCAACKRSGWIEVCGAGMVHPAVLAHGGIRANDFCGFAWGMGVERLVMLQYGIEDVRQLVQNDLRFLRQFQPLS